MVWSQQAICGHTHSMAFVTRISGRGLTALLPDLSAHPGPRYGALAAAITGLLMDGRVAPGTRLPSERELALSLRLSRATVTSAYDALREEGLLTSRTGSGSVTALPRRRSMPPARRSTAVPPIDPAPLGGLVTRGIAERRFAQLAGGGPSRSGGVIDLAVAALPAPPELAGAATRAASRLGEHSVGGGYEPAGLGDLRAGVADRFAARGVPTRPEQILITNGAQHGVDLLLRLFTSPGDRVLTELPTYSGLFDAVRASGARTVAVPVDPAGGWQMGPMTAALRQNSPVLAVLIPDFHNPTGHLVHLPERREIVRAARRTGTTVVADESYVDLGFVDPEVPMAALDHGVVTIGSLSKSVWGGLRVGWVRGSVEVIQRLTAVRATVDMGQSVLDQLVVLELMSELDAIAARRRAQILPRRDALLAELATRFPAWRPTRPDGGLCTWIELDVALATALVVRAGQYGIRVVAGSRFGLDGTMERFLRLPYALPEAELVRAVELLQTAWHDLDPTAAGGGRGWSPLVVA